MERPMRSLLFVPADRPERFPKAMAAGADVVIVDLEDAVASADKARARQAVIDWLDVQAPAARLAIRINGADTPWFEDDLALAARAEVSAILVPKAEDADALVRVRRGGARALMPLIESAAGFERVRAIARVPGVERLVFGTIDFQLDLGMCDADESELLYFRSVLVLESRLAGIAAPVDGVSTAIDDAARLDADVRRARRLGFGAKLCIHPRQVAQVHASFAPGADEIAWARRVVDASAAAGGAAVAVDGAMVDKPVLLRAQAILAEARRS